MRFSAIPKPAKTGVINKDCAWMDVAFLDNAEYTLMAVKDVREAMAKLPYVVAALVASTWPLIKPENVLLQ
jgi:hypothetical protein